MTATVKRLTLGIGAAALAIVVSAGAFVHAQDGGQSGRRLAKDATAGLVGRASADLADRWACCRCSAATSS